MELYREPDMSRFIKINRLRWVGNVQKTKIEDENRVPKNLLMTKPQDRSNARRPMMVRLMDAATANLRILVVSVLNYIYVIVADRSFWIYRIILEMTG